MRNILKLEFMHFGNVCEIRNYRLVGADCEREIRAAPSSAPPFYQARSSLHSRSGSFRLAPLPFTLRPHALMGRLLKFLAFGFPELVHLLSLLLQIRSDYEDHVSGNAEMLLRSPKLYFSSGFYHKLDC